MAKGLLAIGVKRGTHVGIWAGNVPDWLTFLYACATIGAVAVTVNTNYKQAELEYLCQNSDMHTPVSYTHLIHIHNRQQYYNRRNPYKYSYFQVPIPVCRYYHQAIPVR